MTDVARRSTLDLLRDMEQAGAATSTGLNLSQRLDLTIEHFEAIARFLGRWHDASKFMIGDLILEAEARFGESAYQIAAATERSEKTLANWVWVCSRVARSRRREELPFTQHALVAPMDPVQQQRWLGRAVDEGWSSRELAEAIRADRELEPTSDKDDCGELVEDAARALRQELIACGYPSDLALSVEVTAGPMMFGTRLGGPDE